MSSVTLAAINADPEVYDRMCAGKLPYPSESAASAALRIVRGGPDVERASCLGIYQCTFCKEWHIGH